MSLPNILTISRLLLLPVIIWLFFMEAWWGAEAAYICFVLYVIAAITDGLDGWIARKTNQISAFGTFLDPIADKIFVATLLILLVAFVRLDGLWIVLPILIMSREFLISGLREYLGPKNIQVPVSKLAKWKTATQMIAVGALILGPYTPGTQTIGEWLLLAATVLTLVTGWSYLKAGLKELS
jgi:cardiolipin synthase